MQFLFVPPLLFGNHRCRLPSQTQGLGRVTFTFVQPLLTVAVKLRVVVAAQQLLACTAAFDRVMIALA
jgi:hypothetical protein